MIRETIIKAISVASGSPADQINLEFPAQESFGDFTTNVALGGKNARQKAEEIAEKLKTDKKLAEIVNRIEIAGPGFINFRLREDVLFANLAAIRKEKDKYGSSNIGKGKTVVIDYSSPNIAKPFGIGHLRSTIIGQALYNLYETLGYKVIGDNHLGDYGTQFGALLREIITRELKVDDLTLEELEKIYVDFHKKAEENPELEEEARVWFKKLEEGDSEARKIWKKCAEISLKEFNRIYQMLGVKIDYALGESFYQAEMEQMLREKTLRDRLVSGENNAKVIDLTKAGIKTPLMVLKSDGATTYATRDLATIKYRMHKWKPDIVIYEVGAEQSLHFQQVFAAARILGFVDNTVKLVHTAHGLYLAPDGKKFSTRKGKTIKLEEVLDEAIERAKKLGNSKVEAAKEVGIGAIKYFDLMHSVSSNVVFDWKKMMNLEGNSGPYLQYTVARINSVMAKAIHTNLRPIKAVNGAETLILRDLIKYPEVINEAAGSYSPNLLCNYLFELSRKFNEFYNGNRIIGSENETFRLELTGATGQVLGNGLKILGIDTPKRM